MKRVFIIVLCLILSLSLCACTGEEEVSRPEDNSTIENSQKEEKTIAVQTPYGDLQVPASFEDNVEHFVVSEEPYTLQFKSKDGTELFTLYFGSETENLIGTLLMEEENVVIYASFAELNGETEKYTEHVQYQEGINTILHNLMENDNFVVNEAVEFEDTTTFDIKTSVTTLKYPNKWKDKVSINVTDKKVAFSCGEEKLFDLVFEECDGYLLGMYDNTPIYIVSYDFDESKYEEDEQMELYGMSNSVNVILQYLMEDSNFVINY